MSDHDLAVWDIYLTELDGSPEARVLFLSEPTPVAGEADAGCCLGFRLGLITRSLLLLTVAGTCAVA